MKILNPFKAFKNAEADAARVNRVAVTDAIVGLGMVIMTTIGSGMTGLGDAIVDDRGARSAG